MLVSLDDADMDIDFLSLDSGQSAKKIKMRGMGPLSVKLKPKRGKSTKKQKRRLAAKLDKVGGPVIRGALELACSVSKQRASWLTWDGAY